MAKTMLSFDGDLLEGILNSSALNSSWRSCLDAYEELSGPEKVACLKVVIARRDQVVDIIKDVSNPEERQVCLSLFYLLLKSEWMLLNTQYTYQLQSQLVRYGVISQAGLLSSLLETIEPYCRPDHVRQIEALLSHLPDEPGDAAGRADALEQQVKLLQADLEEGDRALSHFRKEWEVLELATGKTSAREIVALVREIKDELLKTQRTPSSATQERGIEFDREFGGLSARQVALHIERLETKVRSLENEAQHWTQAQQLLLKELGDADPERLIQRTQELQDQITHLTLDLARSRRNEEKVAFSPVSEAEEPQDLNAMLGSLESALRELTDGS